MSFSVGSFIKSTTKSVVSRLVDDVVGRVSSGLPQSSQLLAKSTAESLINTGAAYTSIEALSSLKTAESVSRSGGEYYALAGKSTARTAGSDLSKLRRQGGGDIQTYLQHINPATKINGKKDTLTILSVL